MFADDSWRDLDRLFAELSLPFAGLASRGSFSPNADVYLTDGGSLMVVQIELAGVRRPDIRLFVEGRTFYLVGARSSEAHGCEAVLQKEIEHGYFFKKILLPAPVAIDKVRAEYVDGMLTVHLPVLERPPVHTVDRMEIRMTVRGRS